MNAVCVMGDTLSVFVHEHPKRSPQASDSPLSKWLSEGIAKQKTLAQCAYGACHCGQPVQKLTTLTCSSFLPLSCRPCNGRHTHCVLQGKDPATGLHLTALASVYPVSLCKSLVSDFKKYLEKSISPDESHDTFAAKPKVSVTTGCKRCLGDMSVEHTFDKHCAQRYKAKAKPAAAAPAKPAAAPTTPAAKAVAAPAAKASAAPATTPALPAPDLPAANVSRPSTQGKQRSLTSTDYRKELDKLKDPTLKPASAPSTPRAKAVAAPQRAARSVTSTKLKAVVAPDAEELVLRHIAARSSQLVPDLLICPPSIPLLPERKVVATLCADASALRSVVGREEELAEAWMNDELVWTSDDEPDVLVMPLEVRALHHVFAHVLTVTRTIICAGEHASPNGDGDVILTIAKLRGHNTTWRLSCKSLNPDSDSEAYVAADVSEESGHPSAASSVIEGLIVLHGDAPAVPEPPAEPPRR